MRLFFTFVFFLLLSFPAYCDDLPTIAIVDFTTSKRTPLVTQLPKMLDNGFINSGCFNVVERNKLSSIIHEHDFSASGLADPGTAIEFGKLLVAGYVMTGHIVEVGAETRDFRRYGVSTRTTFYRLKVNVRILDANTGKAIFSTIKEAEEKQYSSSGLRINDSGMFDKLAEKVSHQIVQAVLHSKKFSSKEKSKENKMVKVNISSSPNEADIEVNGVFYGNAGEQIEIPQGIQNIKISLPGYKVWEKKVFVREGLTIKATLMEKKDIKIEIDDN